MKYKYNNYRIFHVILSFLILLISITYSLHDEDSVSCNPKRGKEYPEKFRYGCNWYYDFSCQGCVAKKNEFLRIALIATIFSVLGALFGYLIGYVFFNEIGVKIFELYGYEDPNFLKDKFSTKGGFFSRLGILVTAGFTPLPFKLLTISSGFIHFNLIFFIIICVLTRGSRFFLVAFLTYKFGQKFGPFLEKEGAKWSVLITIFVLVIAAGFYFLLK